MTGALHRRGATALALLLALAAAGCAVLRPEPPPPEGPVEQALARADTPGSVAGTDAGEAAAGAPAAPVSVQVEAPGELRALLERHLDLARLARIAGTAAVSDTEWQRLVSAAPGQVRELVQTEGYFSPVVEVARPAPQTIRVRVDPGPRTRVARLAFEVEGPLERQADAGDPAARELLARLRAAWLLQPGTVFRNEAWSEAKTTLIARMRAAGYANAAWIGTGAEVDAEAHQARLFVAADSGPLYRFGALDIEGLVAHDAKTVRNLAAIEPGAPVTDTLLLDYQERLQKANLFESVTVTLDPDPERADAARVVVRLREAALQLYTVGVGVSANTGPRVSLEHTHRRPLGWAAIARNKFELGRDRQAWDGELASHVREGLYRNLVGGAIERLETSSDVVLSQRLRVGRSQDTQRIERLYFVEAERSSRETIAGGIDATSLALSINYHGVWRELDSVVLPTQGFTLALQGGLGRAHSTDAPSGPYTRAYGRFTAYRPLGDSWYANARLELGQVFVRNGVVVPDSQRFRAGGDDSVRGYGYRELGPVSGGVAGSGNVLLTSSVELARPLSARLPSVWGAVFVDAGNAADRFSELDPAVGLGVGVRWRSPVGPLRLDWAWARETHKPRLHFSVGIAF